MAADQAPWAESGALKMARAGEHIAALEAEIRAFYAREPYVVVAESELDTRAVVQRARVREQPPAHLALVAGDAIHNLRSTLDLLVHQLITVNRHIPSKRSAFPIFETLDDFRTGYKPMVHGMSPLAIEAIRSTAPYRSGNEPLWLLHKLDILDKHRLILPALSSVGTTWVDFGVTFAATINEMATDLPPEERAAWIEDARKESVLGLNWAEPACPVSDGEQLWRVTFDQIGKIDMNPKFQFQIVFGLDPARGKPVVQTLLELRSAVESVVDRLLPFLA